MISADPSVKIPHAWREGGGVGTLGGSGRHRWLTRSLLTHQLPTAPLPPLRPSAAPDVTPMNAKCVPGGKKH
jgi:hypothetical protein